MDKNSPATFNISDKRKNLFRYEEARHQLACKFIGFQNIASTRIGDGDGMVLRSRYSKMVKREMCVVATKTETIVKKPLNPNVMLLPVNSNENPKTFLPKLKRRRSVLCEVDAGMALVNRLKLMETGLEPYLERLTILNTTEMEEASKQIIKSVEREKNEPKKMIPNDNYRRGTFRCRREFCLANPQCIIEKLACCEMKMHNFVNKNTEN